MHHLGKLKPLAQILLRWALAIVFAAHGFPKLFTQRATFQAMFPKMGFPSYFVYIAGSLELFGACLLAVGLFTRLVSLLLAGEMLIVLLRVYWPHGIANVMTYQLEMSLAAAAFMLAVVGAGPISIDRLLFGSKN